MDTNKFVNRHVGISAEDIPAMLETIGVKSLDELIDPFERAVEPPGGHDGT